MIRLRLEAREKTPAWLRLALPILAIIATLALCAGLVALALLVAGRHRVHGIDR